MGNDGGAKRAADFYLKHAGAIGSLYCIIPSAAWFAAMMTAVPFREVYLLRLALAVVVGGLAAAGINRYGVSLWVAKHRSPKGPAGILDGLLVGAACGVGSCYVAPLTALIGTNHPKDALTLIVAVWAGAPFVGALVGAILASIGRNAVDREWPESSEARP